MTQRKYNEVREIIIKRYPHLGKTTSDKDFAINAMRLVMVPGVTLKDYNDLAKVAIWGRKAIIAD